MTATTNPSFESPDDSDHEIWLLRAPAHLDVSELLNGVTLAFDPQPSNSNNILSRFQSGESEYSLVLGDASESDHLRLLVPDRSSSDGNELIPHGPFRRQVQLTSSRRGGDATSAGDGVQADLALAPARDAAPKPALGLSGNGSVDAMRLAYVPVPQRQGLKRRWAMPGSKVSEASPSALYSMPKKARVENENKIPTVGGDTPLKKDAVVSEEKPQTKVAKSSSKKHKKEKKKKEKKSKKKTPEKTNRTLQY